MRSNRAKLLLLAGAAGLLVVLAVLSLPGGGPPPGRTGGLSPRDLREIRRAIAAEIVPSSFFKLSTIRYWPSLFRKRWTVRIVAVVEDNSTISKTRIEPNGSETKISFPCVIQYSASGMTNFQFLTKENGRWHVDWAGREFLPSVVGPRAITPVR